uniref:Uncharacterized protein n=1 Tax=Arundo donax TaxID=35708 RepID=A0A0A8Y435_ARUDO
MLSIKSFMRTMGIVDVPENFPTLGTFQSVVCTENRVSYMFLWPKGVQKK